MSAPRAPLPTADHTDPLAERIREVWEEHDRFVAAGGDPEADLDRLADELFGSDEAQAVLLEYLQWTSAGRRSAWLDGDADDAG